MIPTAIEAQVDINLVKLSDLLREQHGASLAPCTVWRFPTMPAGIIGQSDANWELFSQRF